MTSLSRRRAFTLVEVLVALALAGLVLVPAVLHLQRLLREDRALDEALSTRLRSRETPPCPASPPPP